MIESLDVIHFLRKDIYIENLALLAWAGEKVNSCMWYLGDISMKVKFQRLNWYLREISMQVKLPDKSTTSFDMLDFKSYTKNL